MHLFTYLFVYLFIYYLFIYFFIYLFISIWFKKLTIPIHLSLINRHFVPRNLISAQGSSVPCEFPDDPQTLTLNIVLSREKGTQICFFFLSKKFQKTNPIYFPQQSPLCKKLPVFWAFFISLIFLIKCP